MLGSVNMTDLPMRTVFELKGTAGEVAKAVGVAAMPARPNSRIEEAEFELHWVGPETWMLTAAIKREAGWSERLEAAADSSDLLAVLVSDLYRFVGVTGTNRYELLAASSSIDVRCLEPDTTLFTEVYDQRALLIVRSDSVEVGIENSLHLYVSQRIRDAAGQ